MPDLPMRLVYSVRSADEVIYADELAQDAVLTFTREAARRVDRAHRAHRLLMVAAAADAPGTAFVCGSNGFVEAATGLLLEAGFDAQQVKTERFGPTG